MQLFNGTILQGGKYKIIRFINSGGFGCTYEAEHVMLKKRVAIKEFFMEDFCNRDEHTACVTIATESKRTFIEKLQRKFIDEAQTLASFHHPGIVNVSDVFSENGTAYYVMDYIEGQSLSEMLEKRGPLSEADVLKYMIPVAEALRYVHERNRLHMDVKPSNIMIDGNDHAILIDFGASKHYSEETGRNTSTLTGINTPGYAPVEQINQTNTTFSPSTDIYALGATFYKLLTGITPPNSLSLMTEEVHLAPLPQSVSTSMRCAVEKAMQIKRCDRPQSIGEFLQILGGGFDEKTVIDDSKLDDTYEKTRISSHNEEDEVGERKETKDNQSKKWIKPYVLDASKRHPLTNVLLYGTTIIALVCIPFLVFLMFLNQSYQVPPLCEADVLIVCGLAEALCLLYCNSLIMKWKKDGLYLMPVLILLVWLYSILLDYGSFVKFSLWQLIFVGCYLSAFLLKKNGKNTWMLCQNRFKKSKLSMKISLCVFVFLTCLLPPATSLLMNFNTNYYSNGLVCLNAIFHEGGYHSEALAKQIVYSGEYGGSVTDANKWFVKGLDNLDEENGYYTYAEYIYYLEVAGKGEEIPQFYDDACSHYDKENVINSIRLQFHHEGDAQYENNVVNLLSEYDFDFRRMYYGDTSVSEYVHMSDSVQAW